MDRATWAPSYFLIDKVTSPKAYRGTVFQRVTTNNR